jgi:pseudaminic acid biosynthesis-associated methylase
MALTRQLREWEAEFGRAYTDRSAVAPEAFDDLCKKDFGVSRTEINQRFLRAIPKEARILEVGCNIGNQLLLLQKLGYSNLYGIDVQGYALERARLRSHDLNLVQASAFGVPYQDGFFDLVFTAGVLIHIAPRDLALALGEIHRCSRAFIMATEYYASEPVEVCYRGKEQLLWKMDYAREYLSRFSDLHLVKEERLSYLELGNEDLDTVFLLRKAGPQDAS